MNTSLQPMNSPTLWEPSDGSEPSSTQITEFVEREAEIGLDGRTKLLPAGLALSLMAAIDSRSGRNCSEDEARGAAEFLVGQYPARSVHNADIFAKSMTAMFAAYPRDLAKRVTNPVTGLASRLKFLPTLAEVKEALDAEKSRRFRLRATAKWMLDEHERRKAAAEEEAKWNLTPEEMEKRRLQDEALGLSTAPVETE